MFRTGLLNLFTLRLGERKLQEKIISVFIAAKYWKAHRRSKMTTSYGDVEIFNEMVESIVEIVDDFF